MTFSHVRSRPRTRTTHAHPDTRSRPRTLFLRLSLPLVAQRLLPGIYGIVAFAATTDRPLVTRISGVLSVRVRVLGTYAVGTSNAS